MIIKISSTEGHGVFLFTDTQIKDSQFLDDINCLLKSGEILHLFSPDEIKEICEKMGAIDKQRDKSLQTDGSPKALYDLFISLIREQLHIILCVSPVSDKFRHCILNYPAFINCCTIDWFNPWPDDALLAIAHRFLAEDVEFLTEPEQTSITASFVEFFKSASLLANKYYNQYRKHIYIPPMTYIESITTFKDRLIKKKAEFEKKTKRYRVSLARVDESAEQVVAMQKSLEALEPQCKIAAEKVSKQIADVQQAQEAVDEQRELVKKDEEITAEHSSKANDLNTHCTNIMEDVLPQMQEAEEAINSLTPADLAGVRTMKSPPMAVKIVMEAICILRDVKTEKSTIEEYWSASKKMLNDPKFIESLLSYEKDAIPDHIGEKMQEKILSNDAFDVEKLKLVSMASELLCRWVIAVTKYNRAAKIASPKRIELKAAETVRDASIAQLNSKMEELRFFEETLSDLQKQLLIEKEKSESLKSDHERCTKRLQRATEIVASLGGEKERWESALERIQKKSHFLISDILLSCGIVAYLGQFNEIYRAKQMNEWIEKCISLGLYCDP